MTNLYQIVSSTVHKCESSISLIHNFSQKNLSEQQSFNKTMFISASFQNKIFNWQSLCSVKMQFRAVEIESWNFFWSCNKVALPWRLTKFSQSQGLWFPKTDWAEQFEIKQMAASALKKSLGTNVILKNPSFPRELVLLCTSELTSWIVIIKKKQVFLITCITMYSRNKRVKGINKQVEK